MKTRKAVSGASVLLLALAATLPVARASVRDESTQMTFSQPIEIPGQTLPPGTYSFKILNTTSGRDIVEIASPDGTQVYATVLTRGCERPKLTDQTEVKLAERESDQAQVLTQWFYPGMQYGHEFVYSPQVESELASEHTVLATEVGPDSASVMIPDRQ